MSINWAILTINHRKKKIFGSMINFFFFWKTWNFSFFLIRASQLVQQIEKVQNFERVWTASTGWFRRVRSEHLERLHGISFHRQIRKRRFHNLVLFWQPFTRGWFWKMSCIVQKYNQLLETFRNWLSMIVMEINWDRLYKILACLGIATPCWIAIIHRC